MTELLKTQEAEMLLGAYSLRLLFGECANSKREIKKLMIRLYDRFPRECCVVFCRFYRNDTLAHIGERLGVTGTRIQQMEAKGLRVLRQMANHEDF